MPETNLMQFASNRTDGSRYDQMAGQRHLVLPVIALVPGVLNAELVPPDEVPALSVPWWAEKGWPVLRLGSTMSWSPDPGSHQENRPVLHESGELLRISLARQKVITGQE